MADSQQFERRSSDTEVAALRGEVAALREATTSMTEQVGSLAGALTAVNELQEHQIEIESTAKKAATRVEEVEGNSNRRASRLTKFVVAMIIVGVLFVVGSVIAAAAYVHSQHQNAKALAAEQAKTRQASFNSCTTRNQSLAASKVLLDQIIQAERKSVDQKTAQGLIAALMTTQSQQKPVDCTAFLKP